VRLIDRAAQLSYRALAATPHDPQPAVRERRLPADAAIGDVSRSLGGDRD